MNKNKPLLIYVSPKSSSVKEFNVSLRKIALSVVLVLIISSAAFKYSVDFIVDFSQNSKVAQLRKENEVLQAELKKIDEKISDIRSNISSLVEKDDQIRAMLDLPPISPDVRQVGIGGADPGLHNPINMSELSLAGEISVSLNLLEKLEREIRLEKQSYQKLITTVERHQDSLQYLPVLNPVQSSYVSSGFGNRTHPIRRRTHFHKGVDLVAHRGTPVIAPADGYVVSAGLNGGYGKYVSIDHKYGFETNYGHLNKLYVRKGQFVKRGDKIGEVGSTGLSTSSHLHYEVYYNGKAHNPSNYFLKDIKY